MRRLRAANRRTVLTAKRARPVFGGAYTTRTLRFLRAVHTKLANARYVLLAAQCSLRFVSRSKRVAQSNRKCSAYVLRDKAAHVAFAAAMIPRLPMSHFERVAWPSEPPRRLKHPASAAGARRLQESKRRHGKTLAMVAPATHIHSSKHARRRRRYSLRRAATALRSPCNRSVHRAVVVQRIQPVDHALHRTVERAIVDVFAQAPQPHHHRQFFRRSDTKTHTAAVDEQ